MESGSAAAVRSKGPAIATRQVAVCIDDVPTDVVISVFTDALWVVALQRGRIGHLFECSSDGGSAESETFSVACLLGSRGGVEEVFARQIVAALSGTTERRMLVGLGLQSREPPVSVLHGLLAVLRANVFWKK